MLDCSQGHCHRAGHNECSLSTGERGENKQHSRFFYKPSWEKSVGLHVGPSSSSSHLDLNILSHPERWDHLSRAQFCDLFSPQRGVLFSRSRQTLTREPSRGTRAVRRGWQYSLLSLDQQIYCKGCTGLILSHSKCLVLC